MIPARGRCLVRKVETSESYAGGKIVLPEAVREKIAAQQVEIVAVGSPEWCENEDCDRHHVHVPHSVGMTYDGIPLFGQWGTHPFHVKQGDWALIAPRSLVESGAPETYVVRHDDVLAILTND